MKLALDFKEKVGETVGSLAMCKSAKVAFEKATVVMKAAHAQFCMFSSFNLVLAWGRGDRGALGMGNVKTVLLPTRIEHLSGKRVVQISAGAQHVLLRTALDGSWAFGNNDHGRLGLGKRLIEYFQVFEIIYLRYLGDTTDRLLPTRISTLDDEVVISLSAGGSHSADLIGKTLAERHVWSWGEGTEGRLGHRNELDQNLPLRISELRAQRITLISCGGARTLAASGT